VTGPQRSGTSIASQILAAESGYRCVDEREFAWHDLRSFRALISTPEKMIIQCPSMSHLVEEFGQPDNLIGAFAENYAAQQLTALGARSLHYWKSPSGEAEVDFLHQYGSSVLPLEIKAGTNVRSRSLGIYTSRFAPPLALRASLQNLRRGGTVLNLPLYALPALPRIIKMAIAPTAARSI
jgi:hypothetical protein